MNRSGEDTAVGRDDAVEVLLGRAVPRPQPPAGDEMLVRDAVYAEWKSVAGKRRVRRRLVHFGIAATVLLAVAVSFNVFRVTGIVPAQVASIAKSHGSVFVLGSQSELHELTAQTVITSGQTMVTGSDAGIALAWSNGGSLRIDANSRVDFRSADAIYLRQGQVYFDSGQSDVVAGISGGSTPAMTAISDSGRPEPQLTIETDHGSVTHLGTQFMTYADATTLRVSVREGKVAIDGRYHDETAERGQQLILKGSARPMRVNFKGYGDEWQWVERIAPATQPDGKTVDEFLHWVSRETGLQLAYESATAERLATERLKGSLGSIDTQPKDALRLWMMGLDLNWRIDGGVIYVSAIDSGSRQ
jgi:FecR protein